MSRLRALAAVLVACTAASCALLVSSPTPDGYERFETAVRLHDHDLTLRLLRPPQHAGGPLLLYATGDGGWWGGDVDVFNQMIPWGYPLAGFSAREYVHHLGPGEDTLRPRELGDDYVAIVERAKAVLGLPPGTRVILVGKSRGSGLAVAAAERARVRPDVQGILAIALTKEEEYVTRPANGPAPAAMVETYDVLPRLGPIPIAVIQSTRDNYLPAGAARALFGPDTPSRLFLPVDAANHNFDGGIDTLYTDMKKAFDWIVNR
jgi:acetyl esterase/lipase